TREARNQAGGGGATAAANPGQDRALLGQLVARVYRERGVRGPGRCAKADWPVHRPLQLPTGASRDRRTGACRSLFWSGLGSAADAASAGGGQCSGAGTAGSSQGAVLLDRPGGRPAV